MIKEVSFFSESALLTKERLEHFTLGAFALEPYCKTSELKPDSHFEIVFTYKIEAVRTASYTWSSDFAFYIAGPLSPKILRLENGMYVQANTTVGFWEIDPHNHYKLLWRLNPDNSRILAQYEGQENFKTLVNVPLDLEGKALKLLVTDKKPLEWSRSKIPFSAIACFTDHCDFDTLENLKLQRELFKQSKVKVTKGLFLHHFSKREDNASWENDAEELQKWVADGHELAYHSLSQSLKEDAQSFTEFQHFEAPQPNMPTWIDHGFQPYNLSLIQKNNIKQETFFSKMQQQHICNFWNYIDSGTATQGVVNQLNPQHFTLNAFYKGLQNTSFKDKTGLLVKNIFFHFYANEALIATYKTLASRVKKVLLGRKLHQLPGLFKAVFSVIQPLAAVLLHWRKSKNRVYPLAKYNPLLFSFTINGKTMSVFQTLELLDFKNTLSPKMLDAFSGEKGVFIAHTYFSVPMAYHKGRMFTTPSSICPEVAANFSYLGKLIKEEKIWNPTFMELASYFRLLEQLVFDLDTDGTVISNNNPDIHFRYAD